MTDNERQFENFIRGIEFDDTPDLSHRDKLEQDLLAATTKQTRRKETPLKIWRIIMKSQITRLTTAAVIVIAILLAINTFTGTTAWAQVIKAFNNAANIHVVKTDTSDDGRITRENESWIKNQILFRAEAPDWCVIDDGRNVLTLYKDNEIAHIRESFTPYWDYTPLILKVFRDMESENGIQITSLPQESTEDTLVYQIDFRDYWQGKAWVDAASSLPMQIVGRENEDGGWTRNFEITFDYEPIPDETFDTAIPLGFTELPRIVDHPSREGRQKILLGSVVDEQGNPVASAKVFASFAHRGRADENGNFSLIISPTDSTNSLGPVDFPMFVWAFEEDDPFRIAWTIIRHPRTPRSQEADAVLEETHQGVELLIKNEDELAQSIPGDPGQFFGGPEDGPKVRDIVLVMAPASVITGRVANASGEPIANEIVWIEELKMQLGTNWLTISNLDHDWKAEAFAVTDNNGYYELTNLPASWDNVKLKVEVDGYGTAEQQFESDGRDIVEGCDIQLLQNE